MVKKGTGYLFNSMLKGNLQKNVSSLIFGRNDYSPSSKRILQQYGNERILGMTLWRHPLNSFFLFVANKIGTQPFDKLFHLYLEIKTSKGSILIEKNEVINIGMFRRNNEDDFLEIHNNIPHITINYLLRRTQQRMGKNYFEYSANHNNCQDFILNILQANNIHEGYDFIKQDTQSIFKEHRELRQTANTLTDIAGRLDVLKQGGKIK